MRAERIEAIVRAVDERRLLDTAKALIEIPSPTRSAGQVADRLAGILAGEGFAVERPVADWAEAPAVVARLSGRRSGRVLQFDGHLDTVHLPFVPLRCEAGWIGGSGAADMKGGIAACVEAMRVLRQTGAPEAGAVLLTAHDHHEGPWGDKRQLRALIREGYTGDGVLLPEYLADRLPVAGRGMAIFSIRLSREGEPVHEVLRPEGQPDVLAAGAELALRCRDLGTRLRDICAPHAGTDSIFVGHLASGEIYNQAPAGCLIEGTRRWVTPGTAAAVRAEFEKILEQSARDTGVQVDASFDVQAEAFRIDARDPLVEAFQQAHQEATGRRLPLGGKPFVDDGNSFAAQAGIPALTHGPAATGAHTLDERVPVAELVRVAAVYALTALNYCAPSDAREPL